MNHPALAATLDRLAQARLGLPVRRTERLVLRPWRDDDRAPFAALNADPEVTRYLRAPLSPTESDALIEQLRREAARRGLGIWAVEERDTRAFVGMVGLWVTEWEAPFTPAVELVWRLARPAWGRGFATEAARGAVRHAFETLRLPQVQAWTAPDNERSWRVMERLGMTPVGEFDHPRLPEGHPLRRHVRYVLDAPAAPAAPVEARPPEPVPAPSAPARPALPRVWLDGDGCPRATKDLVWRAAERGAVDVTLVANRPVVVPRSPRVRSVVVSRGLDVADDWLVAHAGPGDLVVTADVPLAAELVARGVAVVSPRGERFTPENMGEKLSIRDFFTEARASGLVEGGGPPPMDERARRAFADALERWIVDRRRRAATEPP